MKTILAFFMITASVLFLSCNHTDKKDNTACTMEYRMLTVSVRDSASKPVHLTGSYMVKTSTGELVDFSNEDPYIDSVNKAQGIYFLFTDGKMALTAQGGTEFVFHGKSGSTEIINEKYIIGNDGCHVQQLSGKSVIVIPK